MQAKVGVNEKPLPIKKDDICFVMVDNAPHLNEHGIEYFAQRSQYFYLITNNKTHPAFSLQAKYINIRILFYEGKIDFIDAFRKLKEEYGVEKMTIQSGGELNAELIRNGLIDKVMVVIAPALIGGRNTPTLVDGESLHKEVELEKIKALKLKKIEPLENSYVCLHYDVMNETQIVCQLTSIKKKSRICGIQALILNRIYFTVSKTALNAFGSVVAKSDNIFLFISTFLFFNAKINLE